MKKNIIVSGMQPTGELHIGNYLGALKNFVKLQDEGYECFFFIADYHSMTISYDPKEKTGQTADLVLDYLAACRERGILQVRIIHGKGVGNLRRTVHAILAKHPDVVSFALDYPQFGGWGATIVQLRKLQE